MKKQKIFRTVAEKRRLVQDAMNSGNVAKFCRKHKIDPAQIYAWRDRLGDTLTEEVLEPVYEPKDDGLMHISLNTDEIVEKVIKKITELYELKPKKKTIFKTIQL